MNDNAGADANGQADLGLNLEIIENAARSMRRMKSDEAYDDSGERTIWHRGRKRTEMLTWENQSGDILRQELTLFGMVIEARMGRAVRTGEVPQNEANTGHGAVSGNLLSMHAKASPATLGYASHLLKNIRGRDYYAQHLLKRVNETIASQGFGGNQTAVSDLDSFSRASIKRAPHTSRRARRLLGGWRGTSIMALCGILVGALLGWFLSR